jgi:hypothetical protein
MAKRKSRKRKSSRRRRIGAVTKFDIQATALGVAGAIAASKLQAFLSKDPTKTTMVNIAPFAPLAAAIIVPMFVKNPFVKALAVGAAIQGGVSVLKKLAPGIVGNFAFIPIVSGTTNEFRNIPKPALNVVGYPLPKTSVYSEAMSVVSGIGNANSDGSGAASPWN